MSKVAYIVKVNDGCTWGNDDGYPTYKEALKELREIRKEDIKITGIRSGVGNYYIEKQEEIDGVTHSEVVYEI